MNEAAIDVEDLHKYFGDVRAVDGITLDVAPGTIFGLLGRNGAGKTTTLETCIGLQKPTTGSVRVFGLDPTRRADFARLRRLIGVQLQATSLPEKALVREILTLFAAYYGIAPQTEALATRVGLGDKLNRFVGRLSGGEQQRLALALALLHDPPVLFLDEPSAGMDAFGRRVLWTEVDRLRSSGKTVVLTTHYIEEAERLCDEICIMQAGKIVARDTPAALIAAHGGAARIAFFAGGFTPSRGLEALGRWTKLDERWTLAVSGEPGAALGAIVAEANAGGVTIEQLDLRRPNLEDAFIAITGESLDEDAGENAA